MKKLQCVKIACIEHERGIQGTFGGPNGSSAWNSSGWALQEHKRGSTAAPRWLTRPPELMRMSPMYLPNRQLSISNCLMTYSYTQALLVNICQFVHFLVKGRDNLASMRLGGDRPLLHIHPRGQALYAPSIHLGVRLTKQRIQCLSPADDAE